MSITPMHRTLFIGDVHGCALELEDLLSQACPSRVFLTGDLFTKGPDALACWRLIESCAARSVLGNHDARMLEVQRRAVGGEGNGHAHRAVRALAADPAALWWLSELPTALQGEGWLLVHAGVHPLLGLAETTQHQRLNLRRWPDDTDPGHPHWWSLYADHHSPDALPMVIHGHDAVQGFRDQRPLTLGLDGGCVYGGALWGYLLEEDRLLRVPARQVWLQPDRS